MMNFKIKYFLFISFCCFSLSCNNRKEEEWIDMLENSLTELHTLHYHVEYLERIILCNLTNEIINSYSSLQTKTLINLNNEFYDIVIKKSPKDDDYYFEVVKYDSGKKYVLHKDEYADLFWFEHDQGAWLKTEIIEKQSHLEVYQIGYSFGVCSDIILTRKYELHPSKISHSHPFIVKNETHDFRKHIYNLKSERCYLTFKEDFPFLMRIDKRISLESEVEEWDSRDFLPAFLRGRWCSYVQYD